MLERQLDLFAQSGVHVDRQPPEGERPPLAAERLDDAALVAAIADAALRDSVALAAEAGRRRLVAAVPALAALCLSFAGFGAVRTVPEQAAALQALAAIGGREAAQAVASLIDRAIVQGPGLRVAVSAAAQLGARLRVEVVARLLRHDEPAVRAAACRCARQHPEHIGPLVDLMADLDPAVARAAACALGRLGRSEALPALAALLRDHPSDEVIDAVASVADEDCIVLLGQLARSRPELADAALAALEEIDHPRAGAIAAAARGARSS